MSATPLAGRDPTVVVGALLASYAATAAVHFRDIYDEADAVQRTRSKVLPIGVALLLALTLGKATLYGRIVAAGVVLCGVGDVFMELRELPGNAWMFLAGLGAFLLGHVLFIVAFATNRLVRRAGLVAAMYALSQGIFWYLYPHVDAPLVVPVFAYSLAIGSMAAAALCREPPAGPWAARSKRCGAAGALVFVASDTVLAINMFATPVPGADWLIMTTYYAAVLLIAASAAGGGGTGA